MRGEIGTYSRVEEGVKAKARFSSRCEVGRHERDRCHVVVDASLATVRCSPRRLPMKSIPLALGSLALMTTLALATPAVRVQSIDGVPRVELLGDFARSRYAVFRATAPRAAFVPVGAGDLLCMGPCFVDDPAAHAGETYWYRFDLLEPDGSRLVFGPYAVTIPAILARPVGARVVPNPVRGAATLEIFLGGSAANEPVPARVRIVDLQGRIVREIHDGPLSRGLQRLGWDGRDRAGRPVAAGVYLVTVDSPLGSARTRLLRVR